MFKSTLERKEYAQKWHIKHREERLAYCKKWYIENKQHVKEYCRIKYESRKQELSKLHAIRRANLRLEMIKSYGSYCRCCGESTPEFLTLDHIFRDGARERKTICNAEKLYFKLKNLGWPKDRHRLLCMNCNHAMGRRNNPDSLCPHERQFRLAFK